MRLAAPNEIVEVITRLIELDIPDALALAKAAVRWRVFCRLPSTRVA
ncbi:MAG: hypothetical protein HY774_26900 [Acidobacteria bacterium]|nr:hypothetical protein [Acidobacteriota bacterium]